jgi:peptidoglycan/LPS O-acetylase OafA/YrhL
VKIDMRYIWLDLVRGLAAVAVCASHLRNGLIVDYGQYSALQEPNIAQKVFYFSTGLGHQAVIIFFVLSGFFVGSSIIKNVKRFNFTKYMITRLSRLWIVLIPALILTAIVDSILMSHSPEILSGTYNPVSNSLPSLGKYSSSWSTFFGNIFFLQGMLTPVFGTNGPLWSLANEFWYYILFPLLLITVGKCGANIEIRYRFITLTLVLGICLTIPIDILEYFFIWLMGVGVFLLTQKLQVKSNVYFIALAFGIFLASLIYSKLDSLNKIWIDADFVVALGFSILCFFLSNKNKAQYSFNKLIQNLSVNLSNISYSIYLSHFPFVVLIIAFGFKMERITPNATGVVIYSLWLISLICVGSIFWYLFERHTYTLKYILLKAFANYQSKH